MSSFERFSPQPSPLPNTLLDFEGEDESGERVEEIECVPYKRCRG
jgi:hypothetical protein